MANVYIVCRSGVEWNDIIAVYADESAAQADADARESVRLLSTDVIERMSSYDVVTKPLIDTTTGGKDG